MWEIYSFSDPAIMRMVFNAIGSIFGSDRYSSAAVVVSLAMLMVFSLGSLAKGQKEMPFAQWFVAAIIFSIGFLTRVDVHIEDVKTGRSTKVDNIPIAIAAPAAVISGIGYTFTEMTETAFNLVDGQRVTAGGYLSPLVTIAQLRSAVKSTSCLGADVGFAVGGVLACPTIKSYAKRCTAVKYARDSYVSPDASAMTPERLLKFESDSSATIVYGTDGSASTQSCKEAWPKIEQLLSQESMTKVADSLKGLVGSKGSSLGVLLEVDSSLQAITSSASSARALTVGLYTYNIVQGSTQELLIELGEGAMAENVSSSTQMRNYAWAIQGQLWLNLVDKFLSFMETMIYSIAPFVGLLILTGPSGFKTFTMYAQILIVLQLIPMMLVIVQTILLAEAGRIHDELFIAYDRIYTVEFTRIFVREMEELAGLGGMLAATVVPALAIALVTGSTFALSGALRSAAEPARDTDWTANHVKQGEYIDNISNETTTEIRGDGNYTAKQLQYMPAVQMSQALQGNLAKQEQAAVMANEAYQKAKESVTGHSVLTSSTASQMETWGKTILNGESDADVSVKNIARSFQNSLGLTESQTAQLASTIMGSMDGSLGKSGGLGAALKAAAKIEGTDSETLQKAAAWLASGSDGKTLSNSYSEMASRTESLLEGKSSNYSKSQAHLAGLSEKLQHAKSVADQANESVATARQYVADFKATSPNDPALMIQHFSREQETQDALAKIGSRITAWNNGAGNEQQQEYAEKFQENFRRGVNGVRSELSNISDEEAYTSAMFYALTMTQGLGNAPAVYAMTGDENADKANLFSAELTDEQARSTNSPGGVTGGKANNNELMKYVQNETDKPIRGAPGFENIEDKEKIIARLEKAENERNENIANMAKSLPEHLQKPQEEIAEMDRRERIEYLEDIFKHKHEQEVARYTNDIDMLSSILSEQSNFSNGIISTKGNFVSNLLAQIPGMDNFQTFNNEGDALAAFFEKTQVLHADKDFVADVASGKRTLEMAAFEKMKDNLVAVRDMINDPERYAAMESKFIQGALSRQFVRDEMEGMSEREGDGRLFSNLTNAANVNTIEGNLNDRVDIAEDWARWAYSVISNSMGEVSKHMKSVFSSPDFYSN